MLPVSGRQCSPKATLLYYAIEDTCKVWTHANSLALCWLKKKVWLKKTLHCHDLTKLSSPRSDLWLVLVQAMLKMNRGLVVATNPNSGDAVAETTCAPRNCCRLGPVQCKVCAHGFHPGILRELAPPGGRPIRCVRQLSINTHHRLLVSAVLVAGRSTMLSILYEIRGRS